MKWSRGYISKFWDDDYKNFPYVRQPITPEEVEEWKNKGYDHVKSFTGVMYDSRNPMPEWTKRFNEIFYDYVDITYTFYKMQTLEIMPEHSDHYNTYRKIHNSEYQDVVRILVMLEDWKPGHYLEIDGVGIVNWIAGDYFIWENSCPHAASNIGIEDRYTLQITATKVKTDDIWKRVHWYNIPDLPTRPSSRTPYLQKRILPHIDQTKPAYVYLWNNQIKDLEHINHDQSTVDYLNSVGIDFYLYEPICTYIYDAKPQYFNSTKHTLSFYSEFSGKEKNEDLRVDEFESILEYSRRNNITNIRIHTCDYDVANQYPYYKEQLNLFTNDIFIKSVDPIVPEDTSITDTFTKRFISTNWRWTNHRHMMSIFLSQMDCYLSWYFRSDIYNIGTSPWHNLFEWHKSQPELFDIMLRGIRDLNRTVPRNLDLNITEATNITHPYYRQFNPNDTTIYAVKGIETKGIERFYRDAFCDIVNESRFAQPTGNYSEKVYTPMFYKKPFILLAPPNTLKYLREQGFMTFNDFWDESYDSITDHQERFITILHLIKKLNDIPMETLRRVYAEMIPILEHNYNLLHSKLIPMEKD